jgi:hypothetical protein
MGPHRVNIINILQLIASTEDQFEYQAKAPVNVATELVNQWFDDFYHPGFEGFEAEFSSQELKLLSDFNGFYDVRVSLLPDTLAELHQSTAWAEITARARLVLEVCDWQDVHTRYDP